MSLIAHNLTRTRKRWYKPSPQLIISQHQTKQWTAFLQFQKNQMSQNLTQHIVALSEWKALFYAIYQNMMYLSIDTIDMIYWWSECSEMLEIIPMVIKTCLGHQSAWDEWTPLIIKNSESKSFVIFVDNELHSYIVT